MESCLCLAPRALFLRFPKQRTLHNPVHNLWLPLARCSERCAYRKISKYSIAATATRWQSTSPKWTERTIFTVHGKTYLRCRAHLSILPLRALSDRWWNTKPSLGAHTCLERLGKAKWMLNHALLKILDFFLLLSVEQILPAGNECLCFAKLPQLDSILFH